MSDAEKLAQIIIDQDKEIKELRKRRDGLKKRLATLEKEIQRMHDSAETSYHKLKEENSTLLKASEGLEKAFKEIIIVTERPRENGDAQVVEDIAKKALADFRALKETK